MGPNWHISLPLTTSWPELTTRLYPMAGGQEAPRSQGASDDKHIIKRQRDLREDDPPTPLGRLPPPLQWLPCLRQAQKKQNHSHVIWDSGWTNVSQCDHKFCNKPVIGAGKEGDAYFILVMLKILGLLAQLWAREEYTRVTEIELPAVGCSMLDLSGFKEKWYFWHTWDCRVSFISTRAVFCVNCTSSGLNAECLKGWLLKCFWWW